jgi:hypothetical protein
MLGVNIILGTCFLNRLEIKMKCQVWHPFYLIFIGPCIVIHSYSTTNEMHLLSQIIYSCKTLYTFRTVFSSIIRSSKLCILQRYLSNGCCYLLQQDDLRTCDYSFWIGGDSSSLVLQSLLGREIQSDAKSLDTACMSGVSDFCSTCIIKSETNVEQCLTFMGLCIANIRVFQYTSNKMQIYTVYLYLETAVRVLGVTSTHHQQRKQLYLQRLAFVTP